MEALEAIEALEALEALEAMEALEAIEAIQPFTAFTAFTAFIAFFNGTDIRIPSAPCCYKQHHPSLLRVLYRNTRPGLHRQKYC